MIPASGWVGSSGSVTIGQSSCGQRRGRLGDDDRLEPGGARRGERIGDQRAPGELDDRLRHRPSAELLPPARIAACRAFTRPSLAAIGDDPEAEVEAKPLIEIDAARELVLARCPALGAEAGPAAAAEGRVLAETGGLPGRRPGLRQLGHGRVRASRRGHRRRRARRARSSLRVVDESRAGHPAASSARRRRGRSRSRPARWFPAAPTPWSGSRTPSATATRADPGGRRAGHEHQASGRGRRRRLGARRGRDAPLGAAELGALAAGGDRRARAAAAARASRSCSPATSSSSPTGSCCPARSTIPTPTPCRHSPTGCGAQVDLIEVIGDDRGSTGRGDRAGARAATWS